MLTFTEFGKSQKNIFKNIEFWRSLVIVNIHQIGLVNVLISFSMGINTDLTLMTLTVT